MKIWKIILVSHLLYSHLYVYILYGDVTTLRWTINVFNPIYKGNAYLIKYVEVVVSLALMVVMEECGRGGGTNTRSNWCSRSDKTQVKR